MNRRIMDWYSVLGALALLATGCGDIEVTGGDKQCLIGATQACTCTPGDIPGTRTCGDDNTFGDCTCVVGQPDADATTTPDEGTPDAVPDEGGPDVSGDTITDEGADGDASPPEDTAGDGDATTCTPECGGKECGDDGCGGDCGTCPGAAPVCNADGLCEVECIPNCDGKACGDDGCGGECGPCQGGQECQFDFTCACVSQKTSKCEGGDVYWFDSCGVQGNIKANCNGNGCENGVCLNCTADCTGKACGDDGCGATCGNCVGGEECVAGLCECIDDASVDCVDGDVYWFDSCGVQGTVKETCDYECAGGACQACQPQCTGIDCGDDGCGGTCGSCDQTAGQTCQSGQCLCTPQTVAQCVGNDVYWFDSCGEQGELAQTCEFECANGACSNCTTDCDGKVCGPDGCGGVCGTCDAAAGESCTTAQQCACEPDTQLTCVGNDVYTADSCGNQGGLKETCTYGCEGGECQPCAPSCAGKECGPNGCGGICGTCEVAAGETCNSNGQCVCEPNVAKICIDNNIYWQDACGETGALIEKCDQLECVNGICTGGGTCEPGSPVAMINQENADSFEANGTDVWQSFVVETDGLLVEIHARPQTFPAAEFTLQLYAGPEPGGDVIYEKSIFLSGSGLPWRKFPLPGIPVQKEEQYTFVLKGQFESLFAKGDPYPNGGSHQGPENDLAFRVILAPCQ